MHHINVIFRRVVLTVVSVVCLSAVAVGQEYAAHSVLSSGLWYRIEVNRTGVCRLSVNDLGAGHVNGLELSKIAVYGNGGGQMKLLNDGTRKNDLEQVAVMKRDVNGNGRFDGNDELVFYVEGPDDWVYNSDHGTMEHRRNPYAKSNYYFVCFDATAEKTVETRNIVTSASDVIESYTAVNVIDNDVVNTHETGQIWVGEKFSSMNPQRTFTLGLPAPVSGTMMRIRTAVASMSAEPARFDVSYNGNRTWVSCSEHYPYQTLRQAYLAAGANPVVTVEYVPTNNMANGYLDFIEVNATVPLTFGSGQTEVWNLQHVGTGNVATFKIRSTNANMRVWNVGDHGAVKEMTLTRNGGEVTFVDSTERVGHYVMFDGTSYVAPIRVERVENQDLHGEESVDLVIVTHPLFVQQAEEVAEMHMIYDGLSSLVVTPQKVYNEFSSGRPDPMAVRELLRMMRKRAQASGDNGPRYLLLFGQGTYDNKDILGNNYPTILTCQSEVSFTDEGGSYGTDDMFGYLDDGESSSQSESLDVGIGRLPARNVMEANRMVDKIRRYLERSDLPKEEIRGDWRNKLVFLADDADPSSPGDTVFASSSESMANNIESLYPVFNIEKVYADAYQQQSGAVGSYYPDVNNALRKILNYGCLMFNYVGHGSIEYIGTERYIEPNDAASYTNKDQLAFFVTSTCSYGRFDKLSEVCGCEHLLNAQGGAIATVTASRPIGHIQRFNSDVCVNAITPGNSVGDALRLAKNATSVSHSFVLLGDPALKLSIPQNQVVVTKINGHEVVAGVADSAKVLSEVTVAGEVRNPSGQLMDGFDGVLYATVYDRPTKTHTLANDNEGTEVAFSLRNSVLYRGRVTVTGGRFEYKFIVPRDVAYKYDYAKLSHFAKSASDCASGQYGNLMLGGFDENADLTECRPEIKLYINDTTFRNGGITDENPYIYARLYDKVGINSAGTGIGHDIMALVDDNPNNQIVLNDFYETDLYDSHRGTVNYGLTALAPGEHTVSLKAWNIFNYSATARVNFIVHSSDSLVTGRCFVYPNPSRGRTTIHYEHNSLSQLKSLEIAIYSSSGQVVRVIKPTLNENSYVVAVDWDMQSDKGTPVADGVYMVRITALSKDGSKSRSHTKIVKIR